MIFYFLLLTIFIESKYIFGILNLLLLDYASAVLVFMILKIKKKYGYITTTFIINVIYLVILFYIIKEASVKAIVLMSTVAFILIIYIQIFNYSQIFFFKEDEYIYRTEIFNYILFTPVGAAYIIIIVLIIGLIVLIAGILDSLYDKDLEIV
mgnify:CR=1 FL=1